MSAPGAEISRRSSVPVTVAHVPGTSAVTSVMPVLELNLDEAIMTKFAVSCSRIAIRAWTSPLPRAF